jgi:hypothetical protein
MDRVDEMDQMSESDQLSESDQMSEPDPRDERDQMELIQQFYHTPEDLLKRPIVPIYFAPTHIIPFPLPTQQDIDRSTDVIHNGYGYKVARVFQHFAVKYGENVDAMEGRNMVFVRDNKDIPVPRVYAIYYEEDKTYIVMEYIEGKSLRAEWPILSGEQRDAILAKLRVYMDRLSMIPCYSNTYFGGLFGRTLPCAVYHKTKDIGFMIGPFSNEQDFNEAMLARCAYDDNPADRVNFHRHSLSFLGPHETRFTHDAFRRQHIKVRKIPQTTGNGLSDDQCDYEVTIMGWKRAGWYPSYWEYCSAQRFADIEEDDWSLLLDRILDPYPEEYRVMERLRADLWPRVGLPL